jgi:hypothetical protein
MFKHLPMRETRKPWTCVAAFCVAFTSLAGCRTVRDGDTGQTATIATATPAADVSTWRAPAAPLKSCVHRSEAGMQTADAYLAQVAGKLMGDSPDTFQGEYAPSRFCVGSTARGRLGSHAKIGERQVVIHTESLRQARNDAEVAMVVARQLARITMQEPLTQPADLARFPGWLDAKQKLLVVQSEAPASVVRLYGTWRRLAARRAELEAQHLAALPLSVKQQREALAVSYRTLVAEVASYGLAAADVRQELVALMPHDQVHQHKPALPAAQPGAYDAAKSRELWQSVARLKEGIEAQMARERRVAQSGIVELRKLDGELAHVADAYAEAALREETALSEMRGVAAAARLAAGLPRDGEARVDAAAFTIYLRAGFHPAFFRWQDETVKPTAELAECRALIARAGDVRVATFQRHPLPCWRLYELEVLANRPGAPVWQPLLPRAVTLTAAANALVGVQKTLPPPPMLTPGASSSPDGDLAILIPQ